MSRFQQFRECRGNPRKNMMKTMSTLAKEFLGIPQYFPQSFIGEFNQYIVKINMKDAQTL